MKYAVVLATIFLVSCSTKSTLNKSEILTCFGFCTNAKIEHDLENYPPKDGK